MFTKPRLAIKASMAALALVSFSCANACAKDDPTKEEKALYDALKARFNDNKALAVPVASDANDRRLDVSEFMATENTEKLLAKKDCPAGKAAKKVEIYASFRLVHWEGSEEYAGAMGTESSSTEFIDEKGGKLKTLKKGADGKWPPITHKVYYKFFVAFDKDKVTEPTDDRYLKWFNVSLFYHEMLHGQLTYNRIKDTEWAGWETACDAGLPNANFIKKGVKTADVEHQTIEPAQAKLLASALETKEKFEVTVLEITGEAGKKDDRGNRTFKKEIALPEKFREKDDLSITQKMLKNISDLADAEIDEKKGKITVSGAIGGDAPGRLLVYVDPPSIALLIFFTIALPTDVVIATAIDCDCANTTAPNIGGAATEQCLRQEQNLRQAADKDAIKLSIANGIITSSNTPLCDSVTAGAAGWPLIGGSANSPADREPEMACPADLTQEERVADECGG